MVNANPSFKQGVEIIPRMILHPNEGLPPIIISKLRAVIKMAIDAGHARALFLAVEGLGTANSLAAEMIIRGEIEEVIRQVNRPDYNITVEVCTIPCAERSGKSFIALIQSKLKTRQQLPTAHPMRTRLESPRPTNTTVMGIPIIGGGDKTTVMKSPWYEAPGDTPDADEVEIDLSDIVVIAQVS